MNELKLEFGIEITNFNLKLSFEWICCSELYLYAISYISLVLPWTCNKIKITNGFYETSSLAYSSLSTGNNWKLIFTVQIMNMSIRIYSTTSTDAVNVTAQNIIDFSFRYFITIW